MDTNAETVSNLIFENEQIIYDDRTHSELSEICKQTLKLNSSQWYALYFRKGDVGTLITNYPSEWMSYYHESGYNKIDYARNLKPIYFLPLPWGRASLSTLTKIQKRLFLEASDFHIDEGISLPLLYGNATCGILTFSRSSKPFLLHQPHIDYGFISQGLIHLIQEENLTRRKLIYHQLKNYIQNTMDYTTAARRKMTQAKSYLSLASQVVKEHPGLLESNYFIQKTIEIFDDEH